MIKTVFVPGSLRDALPVAVMLLSACLACGGTSNSWRVFRSLSTGATLGANKVVNPGMETLGSGSLANWGAFGSGYAAATGTAHGGTRSMQCTAATATEVHGGSQTIVLNQTTPGLIKLSGWSRAQGVTGSVDSDYSVYLDILYTDGTPLWGQTIRFSVGTHDWEYKEAFIQPTLPIKQLSCYALFRNSHTGTVWFDDISIAEVQDAVVQFDGASVVSTPPIPRPFNPATRFTLLTGDGLQVQLAQDGGVIEAVSEGSNSLQGASADYASGWIICDRAANSDWWNVGGWVTSTNSVLQQCGVMPDLNLAAELRYSVTNDAIRIEATVSNLVAADRAISLYFALPFAVTNGYWWNTPRDRISLSQAAESAAFSSVELGARNLLSQYPLATVAGASALTLAIPPDQYRPFRLVYNRVTQQFFAAFDLGISALATNSPQTAKAEIWLYRSDPSWGMRSGLEGFYRRFPGAFSRTFTNEGIWVAFADLHTITNISDFGIAYHEIGYSSSLVKFDDGKSIASFRYVSEPWSYWMTMPTNISNSDYNSVYNYLLSQNAQGVKAATAVLSSGLRDPGGLLKFSPAAQPWCPYGAVFSVNPNPAIRDPQYSTTKFNNEWNSAVRDVYNHPENGVLDGEYIDSFGAAALDPDYSTNHMRGSTFPLAYTRDNSRLMTPLIFGTCEMARAIGSDVHALGKPLIGNTVFTWPLLPVGLGLFDFAGTEINCFDSSGNFVPMSDATLLYARALSGLRPYGYLLNTDFTRVSQAEMESYMRLCAVYAIYPSAFSADAASNNYFEQPSLYERDRPLFKKYVPIIRSLSLAGWQPVTAASVNASSLALEAYGTNTATGQRYLAVRNLSSQAVTGRVTCDTSIWAFPNTQWLRLTNLFDGGVTAIDIAAGSNSVSLTLQPYQCTVFAAQADPQPPPVIRVADGKFGFANNRFGFNVAALPGQVVVVEATTNLSDWLPLWTNALPDSGATYFSHNQSAPGTKRFYRARVR